MENTCKNSCRFYKNREKNCPNFILGRWESNDGKLSLIEDCAPIRATIFLRDFDRKLNVLQKEIETIRNQQASLHGILITFLRWMKGAFKVGKLSITSGEVISTDK